MPWLGADNWGIEPYDFNGEDHWATPIPEIENGGYRHMNLTVRRGIYLFENLDLVDRLERDEPVHVATKMQPSE